MDFSLTTLFVLPVGFTLAASGSTEDLVAKKFGIFNADYALSTVGNIAAQPYIYFAQGRNIATPGQGSKRSDKVNNLKVKKWYKSVAEPDVPNQSTVVSNFSVSCGEEISVTIRAHSNYIDTGFFNGVTRSVTVTAPCCDCGGDPCADISASDTQALVDQIVAKFALDPIVSAYMIVRRGGSGASSTLIVEGKPLNREGQLCSDLAANPYEYDRLWYRVFVYKGADTTADFLVPDRCDEVATVTVVSRALYPHGSADQIYELEKKFYSYQQAAFKHLYRNSGFNPAFEQESVPGQFYDTYVLIYRPADVDYDWQDYVAQDATVIIVVPTGAGGPIETILAPYLGAPKVIKGVDVTTTTTTSTSSTTTTTTTTLQP